MKVDKIQQVYVRATTEEFIYALREVADAVHEVLRTKCGLISYAGNGVFVVVSNSAAPLCSNEIEAEVQHLLDEKNSEYDCGAPLD
ncbi:MAG: response regulator, partial [Cypionkella sp.]|uniref:hypothetical protein n=1 Tax=Cypionkella sp. TaxID=2811411 RepID=UPI00261E85E2